MLKLDAVFSTLNISETRGRWRATLREAWSTIYLYGWLAHISETFSIVEIDSLTFNICPDN